MKLYDWITLMAPAAMLALEFPPMGLHASKLGRKEIRQLTSLASWQLLASTSCEGGLSATPRGDLPWPWQRLPQLQHNMPGCASRILIIDDGAESPLPQLVEQRTSSVIK